MSSVFAVYKNSMFKWPADIHWHRKDVRFVQLVSHGEYLIGVGTDGALWIYNEEEEWWETFSNSGRRLGKDPDEQT